MGIVLIIGVCYLIYTTLINKTYYDNLYFQSNIKINEDADTDIEENPQSSKYLFHYAFLLIFISVFVLSFTCLYGGGARYSFIILLILMCYMTFSFLTLGNLYINEKSKALFYFVIQLVLVILYVLYFYKGYLMLEH